MRKHLVLAPPADGRAVPPHRGTVEPQPECAFPFGACPKCGSALGYRWREGDEFAAAPWQCFCRGCGETFSNTNYLPERETAARLTEEDT